MERHNEPFESDRAARARVLAARVALFDIVIDYHLSGHCTFEESMAEYFRAAEEDGIGYSEEEAA